MSFLSVSSQILAMFKTGPPEYPQTVGHLLPIDKQVPHRPTQLNIASHSHLAAMPSPSSNDIIAATHEGDPIERLP